MSEYTYKNRNSRVYKDNSHTRVRTRSQGDKTAGAKLLDEEWDFKFTKEFLSDYCQTVWMYNYEFARSSRQMRQLVWAMRDFDVWSWCDSIWLQSCYPENLKSQAYFESWLEETKKRFKESCTFETDCDEYYLPDDPKFDRKFQEFIPNRPRWEPDNLISRTLYLSFDYFLMAGKPTNRANPAAESIRTYPKLPWLSIKPHVRALYWKPDGPWYLGYDPYRPDPIAPVDIADPYYAHLKKHDLWLNRSNKPEQNLVTFLINSNDCNEQEIMKTFKTWFRNQTGSLVENRRVKKKTKPRGEKNYKKIFALHMRDLGYCRLLAFCDYDYKQAQDLYDDANLDKLPGEEKSWKSSIARTCRNFSRIKNHWAYQPTCFQYITPADALDPHLTLSPAEELIRGKSLTQLIDELKKVLFTPQ